MIISDDNNDKHNTVRQYISIELTYQVISSFSSLIFQVPRTCNLNF